jgi:hypothetical protein
MGSEAVDLGDAFALTPTLFFGYYLPHLDHMTVESAAQIPDAVRHLVNGGTVLTALPRVAMWIMIDLGIPASEALGKLDRANHVLDDQTDISF